jgi:hypothetical protein
VPDVRQAVRDPEAQLRPAAHAELGPARPGLREEAEIPVRHPDYLALVRNLKGPDPAAYGVISDWLLEHGEPALAQAWLEMARANNWPFYWDLYSGYNKGYHWCYGSAAPDAEVIGNHRPPRKLASSRPGQTFPLPWYNGHKTPGDALIALAAELAAHPEGAAR